MTEIFKPLRASSKFAICGLPLVGDTHYSCPHNCVYCFAQQRVIMGKQKNTREPDFLWLRRKLEEVANEEYEPSDFLAVLLREKITWHVGSMADPFPPAESMRRYTATLAELARTHGHSVLFSTKGADLFHWDAYRPDTHTFQISVSHDGRAEWLEPGAPSVEARSVFFAELQNQGFRVGIRIQPFVPSITTADLLDYFPEADYYTIEGLKLVPQDTAYAGALLRQLGLDKKDFTQMGLLNLKPRHRLKLYQPLIDRLEDNGLPYSISDNDLHYISSTPCCCGSPLITKSTGFDNTALFHRNPDYNITDVMETADPYLSCRANHLFASNRQEGCVSVGDFYRQRFNRRSSPFSKKFMYAFRGKKQKAMEDFE